MLLSSLNFKRVVALSPHTDDFEFGAAGFAVRLLESGAEIRSVALSNAVKSLPAGLPPDTLINELRRTHEALGIDQKCIDLYDFPVRDFPSVRQEILECFTRYRRDFAPDLVLVPCRTDVHQDHEVCCMEAIRAFKNSTILGYELPWNNLQFSSTALVRLTEQHVEKKLQALGAYESQKHRPYASPEFIRGWMRGRGVTVGAEFAEAFEAIRLVI